MANEPPGGAGSTDDRTLLLVDAAHGAELAPPEFVAQVIKEVRAGVLAGEDDATLADRLEPRLSRVIATRQAAATLGRRGGRARAAKLSASRRAEIARLAAAARWGNRRQENG